jgi:hypothetical protein
MVWITGHRSADLTAPMREKPQGKADARVFRQRQSGIVENCAGLFTGAFDS